jgi:hypothetical protein
MQFGSIPGVKVSTSDGVVGGATVGREQFTVLVGVGNNSVGSAPTNVPVTVDSRSDATNKFGAGSDLVAGYRRALSTGANSNFVKAVMASTSSATESFTAEAVATLANAPIVRDTDRITITDTTDASEFIVRQRFESPPTAPTESGVAHINPLTGEVSLSTTTDFEVSYEFADWASAFEAVSESIIEGEFALIHPMMLIFKTIQATVTETLDKMRKDYKFGLVHAVATPNATTAGGRPKVDSSTYTNPWDDDRVFLTAPSAIEGADPSAGDFNIGHGSAQAGVFAGAELDDPVFNESVPRNGRLVQRVSRTTADALRAERVIPVRDTGVPTLADNRSTYVPEKGDWERDFFTRRVVDVTVATIQRVADAALGGINDPETRGDLNDILVSEIDDLKDLGILKPDGQFIDVFRIDRDTIGIDIGITPFGVAKQATSTLIIET